MGVPYAEVIGDPIAHSRSPQIHKFWLETLGIEGDYRAVRVGQADVADYLKVRRTDPDWRGCNVTMPLKQAVVPLLDSSRDPIVNCVSRRGAALVGSNTDSGGVDEVIADWGVCPNQARVAMIGAGGAAWAAIGALDVLCYFAIDIIVRDPAKGERFLDSVNLSGASCQVHSLEGAGEALRGRYAVINASPLGMVGYPAMPDTVLEGLGGMMEDGFAFDMVTAPVQTIFLDRARKASLSTSDGLTMLIGQARSSFMTFFGALPPEGLDSHLRRKLHS